MVPSSTSDAAATSPLISTAATPANNATPATAKAQVSQTQNGVLSAAGIEASTITPVPTATSSMILKNQVKELQNGVPSATTNGLRDHQTFDGISDSSDGSHLMCIARDHDAKITRFLETEYESQMLQDVQQQTKISLRVIEEALQRYRFQEIAMSFNGGKDCLVMLILLLCGISRHFSSQQRPVSTEKSSLSPPSPSTQQPSSPSEPDSIPSVYVMSAHPFAEVDAFMSHCITAYQLSVARYPLPMKLAFETYLSTHPKVKAILVGTRRTDPHGENLTFFDRTDHGWPDFMRIHPVIDWHYREIWAFLRELKIEYCSLYDQGYTSLGGTTDTHPNPVLAVKGNEGEGRNSGHKFRPAYELMEDEEERLGRDK